MVKHASSAVALAAQPAPMTYDQAANRAVELRSRGVKFKDIETLYKNEGYLSEKTRRPISAVGIRQMVMKLENRRQEPREPIMLSKGDRSVMNVIERVVAMDVTTDDKVKMIKALLS